MIPGRLRPAVPWALYAVVLLASFYPESFHPARMILYVGDPLESAYLMAWHAHQVLRDPLHLFDANYLYPVKAAVATTEHHLLQGLALAPLTWLTGNPILVFNCAVAMTGLLDAFAARKLAFALGCGDLGSWAAGALCAFNTYNVHEAPRVHIMLHAFLALAVLELIVLVRREEPSRAWRLAGWLLLAGLTANYHLLYGGVLLGMVLAATALVDPARAARTLGRLVLPLGAAALLFLPVTVVYYRMAKSQGFHRELPEGVDLGHYVSTAPGNLLYGPIGPHVQPQQKGPHFIGFAALALAAIGLLGSGRRRDGDLLPARHWTPAAALLAGAFVLLSLGRDVVAFGHRLGPGPYRLLYSFVPGFQYLRIPERFGLLAMLFVALLVAQGLTVLEAARLPVVAVVLAALVPVEHLSLATLATAVPVGDDVPPVYRWLATQPVHALAEVPTYGEHSFRRETWEMYYSTYHFQPIVHGYTAYPTRESVRLRECALGVPEEQALDCLESWRVDTLIVHYPPPGTSLRENPALEELVGRPPHSFYRGIAAREAGGSLQRLASFEGPRSRIPGGQDVAFRIVRPAAPGP